MAFCTAGVTGVCHHTQLVGWDGVLLTFCLGWPPTSILWISTSQIAGLQVWATMPRFVEVFLNHCISPCPPAHLGWGQQAELHNLSKKNGRCEGMKWHGWFSTVVLGITRNNQTRVKHTILCLLQMTLYSVTSLLTQKATYLSYMPICTTYQLPC
jgi:hypothetical protein